MIGSAPGLTLAAAVAADAQRWVGSGVPSDMRPLNVQRMVSLIVRGTDMHGGISPEYWMLARDEAAELAHSCAKIGVLRSLNGKVIVLTAEDILAEFERGKRQICGVQIRLRTAPNPSASDREEVILSVSAEMLQATTKRIAELEAKIEIEQNQQRLFAEQLRDAHAVLLQIDISGGLVPAYDVSMDAAGPATHTITRRPECDAYREDFLARMRAAMADAKPDGGPAADYHGPNDPAHRAVHDVTEHLLGGRVSDAKARRGLRDALDKADKPATGRASSDGALGRALRFGAPQIGMRLP